MMIYRIKASIQRLHLLNKMRIAWMLMLIVFMPLPVYAEDGDAALSIVRSAATASDAVVTKVDAAGKQIGQVIGSVADLLNYVSVCIAMSGMVLAFLEIGLSRHGRLRETAKWKLVGVAIALILIGGSARLVNLFLHF